MNCACEVILQINNALKINDLLNKYDIRQWKKRLAIWKAERSGAQNKNKKILVGTTRANNFGGPFTGLTLFYYGDFLTQCFFRQDFRNKQSVRFSLSKMQV